VAALRRWVRKEYLASRDGIHPYLSLTISNPNLDHILT
jgi:hypothetical protein